MVSFHLSFVQVGKGHSLQILFDKEVCLTFLYR